MSVIINDNTGTTMCGPISTAVSVSQVNSGNLLLAQSYLDTLITQNDGYTFTYTQPVESTAQYVGLDIVVRLVFYYASHSDLLTYYNNSYSSIPSASLYM